MHGKIRSFNKDKHYGFIVDEEKKLRFFHGSVVIGNPILTPDRIVSFDPSENARGLTATNVKVVTKHITNAHKDLLTEIADWKAEAKLEDSLRYFYRTREVEQIEQGKRCYVIGRKGTGKTAICEYLTTKLQNDWFSTKLTFKNFPLKELYALSDNKFTAPNQYITLWKYVIYSKIAMLMCQNENIDLDLRNKLSPLFLTNAKTPLSQEIIDWTSNSFALKLFGIFDIKVSPTRKNNQLSWAQKVDGLEKLILANIDSAKYVIALDELDEDYKNISEKGSSASFQALLTSLFKAVQDVKSIFSSHDGFNILPIVFLRNDIFSQLRDPDRAKWIDLSIELDWNIDKIKNMLAFRISKAISLTDELLTFEEAWMYIFEDFTIRLTRSERQSSILDSISERTLMRPRDYIKFMSNCAEAACSINETKVSEKTLKRVERQYSIYFITEIEDEIQGSLPEIYELWEVIQDINKTTFTTDEFKTSLAYKQLDRNKISNKPADRILSILFTFSVIGNIGEDKNDGFKYLNERARCNFERHFTIHKGLVSALDI